MDRDSQIRALSPESPLGRVARETDEQLLERFRDGEASAFDQLLDRHKAGVYAYLRRSTRTSADAEDLFQEVFLRMIKAAPGWEPRARVSTWLYTIARNAAIDLARRRRGPGDPVPLEAAPGDCDGDRPPAPIERLQSAEPAPDQALLAREHGAAVEALIGDLPEEQREAFLLKRQGLTFEEIAAIAGCSKNTIKSRLRYALDKLRSGLGARGLLDRAGTPGGRPAR